MLNSIKSKHLFKKQQNWPFLVVVPRCSVLHPQKRSPRALCSLRRSSVARKPPQPWRTANREKASPRYMVCPDGTPPWQNKLLEPLLLLQGTILWQTSVCVWREVVTWHRFTPNASSSPKAVEAYFQINVDEAAGDEQYLHPVWPETTGSCSPTRLIQKVGRPWCSCSLPEILHHEEQGPPL